MKVLQINKFLKVVGGAETYMFQLSNSLKTKGIEVKFWGMHDNENIVNDFPDLLANQMDFQNQGTLDKIGSIVNTIYSSKNRKKIAKVLDSYQPDIVHIHNYNFQLSPSILPEINKRGIPVVQTIHDSQMVCPYHRLYNFQKNQVCTKCIEGSFFNCIKDKCFDGSLFKSIVGSAESMLYHSLGYYQKYINTYISPSQFLASLIEKRIKQEIEVVPNFTIIPNDLATQIKPESYYLYYGRISEEKGVRELLEIFKDISLNLIIVGKGPLEDEIVKTANAVDNIKFLGPKYDSELFNLVKSAKYVIQPSKWFENCPMTIIESFALNTPVIGSNHSGFLDLIENQVTGHLIDFTHLDKAKKQILEIDKMPTLKLKKNIQKFYSEKLSQDVHLEKVLNIYHKLLEGDN